MAANALPHRPYSNDEMQLCQRLAGDNRFTEWLQAQADAHLDLFGVIDPSQLPMLQSRYVAVLSLQERILGGVRAAENQRQQLAQTAGIPRQTF